jgi:hypothetical protein
MFRIGSLLVRRGYVLRSGGAAGADTAFERGATAVDGASIVYKAGRGVTKWKGKKLICYPDSVPGWQDWAEEQSSRLHPAWNACSDHAKAHLRRNMAQICGHKTQDRILSHFVLCWTPDGAETAQATSRRTGGTGQAIRAADAYGVPVFNLARAFALRDLEAFLDAPRGEE